MRTEDLVLLDRLRASINSACEWRKHALATRDDRELGYALAMVQANLDEMEDQLAKLEDALREEVEE